jgi:hypothetical protein
VPRCLFNTLLFVSGFAALFYGLVVIIAAAATYSWYVLLGGDPSLLQLPKSSYKPSTSLERGSCMADHYHCWPGTVVYLRPADQASRSLGCPEKKRNKD